MLTKKEIRAKLENEYSYFQPYYEKDDYAIIRLHNSSELSRSFAGLFIANMIFRYDANKMEGEFTKETVLNRMTDNIYKGIQEKRMYAYTVGFYHLPPFRMFLDHIGMRIHSLYFKYIFSPLYERKLLPLYVLKSRLKKSFTCL